MGMTNIAVEPRSRVSGGRWTVQRVLLAVIVTGLLIAAAVKLGELRRYRKAMAEIGQEIRAGRHGHAARKLTTLLAWKPNADEAIYLLGVCEEARGQAQAAFGAWERVAPDSPFGARAIQGRMDLLIKRGRLADAERLITQSMSEPRVDRPRLGLFLGLVYSLQGRIEDRGRVIEACWDRLNETGDGASELAILLVRLHMQKPSIEEVRGYLNQVAQLAPEDDRGWLGRAKLAIRDGAYNEAVRWLDACSRRRPDDIPVWRARLDWALATKRLADVRQALAHLPAAESTPADVERLRARLAALGDDPDMERQALERLLLIEPADLAALDRLGYLAEKAGQPDRAADYRFKKKEIGELQIRFDKYYQRNQTMRDARAMAGLAAQIGRPFEAKVLEAIAIAADSQDGAGTPIVQASANAPAIPPLAGSLAAELAAAERVKTH